MSDFDAMVNMLVSKGFPRSTAEAEVRAQYSELAPPPADVVKDESILEKKEQQAIIDQFRAYGFKVRNISQPRATKQAPGIGDLIVMHIARGIALWWEVKRQVGGRLSPDQVEFEDDCRACGWTYRSGDRYDAARYLVNLGMAEGGDGPNGITPVRPYSESKTNHTPLSGAAR